MKVNDIDTDSFDLRSSPKVYALVLCLAAIMVLFFSSSLCLAEDGVARLIPPDAPVIAGLHRMSRDQSKDALWLATRNNLDDLKRMLAVTASDVDRHIDYVIVADWPSSTDTLGSHVLVARGRFDMASTTSTMAHPRKFKYNGITVLILPPMGGSQQTARWLAVLQGKIAVFGTPSGVQVALDRFRSGVAADPRVMERLANAHDEYGAWSSILLGPRAPVDRVRFHASIDNLTPCFSRMNEIDMGIQLGKTVTLDLHTDSRDGFDAAVRECVGAAVFKGYTPQVRVSLGGEGQTSMRLSLSRAEYDTWLDSFGKSRMDHTLTAFISGAEPAPQSRENDLSPVR